MFQGKIVVKPHAQKTDAKMMTRALLLADEAEADIKPELEIFADDVICGHGAAVGARCEALVLSDVARHSGEGSRGAADPGLPRRGHRGDRARRHPRRADVCGAATGWGRTHDHASGGQQRLLRRRAHPRGFPALSLQVYGKPLVYLDNAASAQKPQAVLDACRRPIPSNTPMCIAACIISPTRRPKPTRARARRVQHFLNAGRKDEIIFTNGTEAINLVAYTFGRERIKAGRRDRALGHGAPFQHRALAFPARAPGRGAQMGAGRRRRQSSTSTSSRSRSAPRTKTGRHHAHVQRARHRDAAEGDRQARACRGIPVLADGAQGAVHLRCRRARHRFRFLRLHRPQALRPDRHRRAVRQARASEGDAAVQWRRRDDPGGVRRTASPMPIRPPASRPARRRSCRRSGWARRSITSIPSARRASARMRASC